MECWRCSMLGRNVGCLVCGILEMWDVEDVRCSGCGMFGMWNVGDVECSRCEMFAIWDVRDLGCSRCGMFEMWVVEDVGCSRCGMRDVGCLPRCEMLIYKIPIFFIDGDCLLADSHNFNAWTCFSPYFLISNAIPSRK